MAELRPNEGKAAEIVIDGKRFLRLPISTHLVTREDHIADVAEQYAAPVLEEGDILFITEKIVACTQGRAIPMKDIKPRRLAHFLSRYVVKTPCGIGLGIPETMEYALKECGTLRILFAAAISVIGKKIFRRKGWFYTVAGYKARSIDGPCDNTIPPYNEYVVLGPVKPNQVAWEVSVRLGGYPVCITDINDLDGQILGLSHKTMDKKLLVRILKDNPLGQSRQQTPMGIIRPVS